MFIHRRLSLAANEVQDLEITGSCLPGFQMHILPVIVSKRRSVPKAGGMHSINANLCRVLLLEPPPGPFT